MASLSNLPPDVTPAMLDEKAAECVACQRPTDHVCLNCHEPLCDAAYCEQEHQSETGHAASQVTD